MANLDDIGHEWGSDLQLSPTGDLSRVSGARRSEQRVIRRLMTTAGDYVWHPSYGAGIPGRIGQALDLAQIRAVMRGQMMLEPSVSRSPAPVADVREIPVGGVGAAVQYTALPDKQPVSLTFELGE